MVTGNTYRNPTLLAKVITTLDVVSAGRAILGIGTGWFELEHDELGYEFGTFTDRFNRLDEALQIILPMLKGERPTFSGKWYRAENALANPRCRDHIPLMIGGSGEKKSCEEIGRDPATLETSMLLTVLFDDNVKTDQIPAEMSGRMLAGSADAIAEQVQNKVLDAGIDGVIINMPFYTPGVVTAVGDRLRPLVGL